MTDPMADPDLVVRNALLAPDDPRPTTIVVRGGRIAACGPDTSLGGGPSGATIVDVGGRRVIPGLIDSHVHVTRGGTTWDREVSWAELTSLREGLGRLTERARAIAPGAWVVSAGGWHPAQLVEGRGPSRADLDAACPDRPCYVQQLYDHAVLNTRALETIDLAAVEALPGAEVERDADGAPTGTVRGVPAFLGVLALTGEPTPQERRRSLRAFVGEMARFGMTGAVDPGGFGFGFDEFEPAFALWRDGELDVRLRLFLCATRPGDEVAEIDELTRTVERGYGDDRLRVDGIGELVVHGCHDMEGLAPCPIDADSRARLRAVSRLVAARGWPMHVHAILDASIGAVLDAWEDVDDAHPVGPLGFTLAHVEAIGAANLERARALGLGLAVQNRLLLRAADSARAWGAEAVRHAPPLGRFAELGVTMGAGTDGTRVAPLNPWRSLWWFVTGRTLDGGPRRAVEHRLSREQALALYTRGSAALTGEAAARGSIVVGQAADLCVLDRDYFAVEEDEIPAIRSDLTLLGGRVTHASGALGPVGAVG
jgi:predicted amidohydrolase YtcJ